MAVLGGLYVAAGGILLRGGPGGRPWGNTVMLGLGAVLALVMGTAGAALVIIQPLLRANAHRRRRFHLVLFLILLVGNTAGVLTPIGNPPLLVGLLRGVPFLWPARNLIWDLAAGGRAAAGGVLRHRLVAGAHRAAGAAAASRSRVRGWGNVVLVLIMAASVTIPASPVLFAVVAGGAFAVDHAAGDPAGQRLLLAPDDRGRGAVRRHLHHAGAGVGAAAPGAGRVRSRPACD